MMFHFNFSVSTCKSLWFWSLEVLKFPSFTDQECCLIQGHIPMLPTIPLFHAVFTRRPDISRTSEGSPLSAYPWMCHEIEIWSFTCAGKTVRATGGLPSHPLSLHPSARWTAWLTHVKVQAKGFCGWIYSSFYKLSSFFFLHNRRRHWLCDTYFNLLLHSLSARSRLR